MMADRSVFISYSTDVERTIASLIRRDLRKHGLRVFPDIQESEAGDSLTPSIRSVTSSDSVWIVVFSKKYAESAPCLNELSSMAETQHSKIIPIFWDIQPWELRCKDKGAYAGAFQDHIDKGVTIDEVSNWRRALEIVSTISGVEFRTGKDDYGERLKKIVETVLENVGGEQLNECVYPVGLDQRADNFINEVLKQGINVAGIVGPPGSGKSCLAARLYNMYSRDSRFKRRCFLSDVSKRELTSLQENLVKDLVLDRNLRIQDTSKGRTALRRRLEHLSGVFIVFDGIENKEQIDNLLFVKDVVGNGSLILVTSRDQTLLVRSEIGTYNVKLLDTTEAQELFCKHAFNHPEPLHGFEDVVEKSVRLCGGLPLDLEFLAGELRNEVEPSRWEQRLKSICKQRSNNWWRGFWIDRMTAAFKAFIFAGSVIGFGVFLVKMKWLRFQMRGSRWKDRMKAVFSAFIRSIISALCCLKVQR